MSIETKTVISPSSELVEEKKKKFTSFFTHYDLGAHLLLYGDIDKNLLEKVRVYRKKDSVAIPVSFFMPYHRDLIEKEKKHLETFSSEVRKYGDMKSESEECTRQILFFKQKKKVLESRIKLAQKRIAQMQYAPTKRETRDKYINMRECGISIPYNLDDKPTLC